MKQELLMSYHANQKPSQPVGKGPHGDNYFMTQPRFETGDERYA